RTVTSEFTVFADEQAESVKAVITVKAPSVSTRECNYEPAPVIGDIQPVEKWHWDGFKCPAGRTSCNADAEYWITYSSPVVGDLDGDGSVEVVTIPSPANYTGILG